LLFLRSCGHHQKGENFDDSIWQIGRLLLATAAALIVLTPTHAQPQAQRGATSYAPVDIKEAFPSIMERHKVPGVRRLAAVAIGWRHRPVEAPKGGATAGYDPKRMAGIRTVGKARTSPRMPTTPSTTRAV
jgi:hypothetical protein